MNVYTVKIGDVDYRKSLAPEELFIRLETDLRRIVDPKVVGIHENYRAKAKEYLDIVSEIKSHKELLESKYRQYKLDNNNRLEAYYIMQLQKHVEYIELLNIGYGDFVKEVIKSRQQIYRI